MHFDGTFMVNLNNCGIFCILVYLGDNCTVIEDLPTSIGDLMIGNRVFCQCVTSALVLNADGINLGIVAMKLFMLSNQN